MDASDRDAEGRLYIGTTGGLVVFHPDSVGRPAERPAISFTNIRVNGSERTRNASYLSVLTLRYDDDVVSIDLAASNPGPERTWDYAYRLDGSQRDTSGWLSLGRRSTIDLIGLAPGTYALYTRSQDANGTGPAQSLVIDVAKPPWETVPFRALVAAALAALLYGAYRYRLAEVYRRYKIREDIADDLHDDLGSKIAAHTVGLDTAGRYGPADDAPNALVRAADDARSISKLLRDAIWLIDQRRDSLASLVDRVEAFGRDLLGPRLTVERPATLPDVPLPTDHRRHLYLLLKEALHNAHRHAAGAPVRFRVGVDGHAATFAVEDDGPGFDPATTGSEGRGLSTLARRARACGAALRIESVPGEGTRVVVRYPLRHSFLARLFAWLLARLRAALGGRRPGTPG